MGVHYAHIVMYIQYITHMHIHGINSNICEHHGISHGMISMGFQEFSLPNLFGNID